MSDSAAEPGAPQGAQTTNMPSQSEKSIASEVKQRVPDKAISLARTPDRIILRLNKYVLPSSSAHNEVSNKTLDSSQVQAG